MDHLFCFWLSGKFWWYTELYMTARTFLNILLTFSEILLKFFRSFAEFAETKSFYRNLSPFCSFLLNALGFLFTLARKTKASFLLATIGPQYFTENDFWVSNYIFAYFPCVKWSLTWISRCSILPCCRIFSCPSHKALLNTEPN